MSLTDQEPTYKQKLNEYVHTEKVPWWFGHFANKVDAMAAIQDAIFFKVDHTMQTDYEQEQSSKQINYAPNVVNDYRIRDQQNADRAKFNSVVERGQAQSVLNNAANGLGIAMGIKQEVLGYAVAQNYKSARNPIAFANLRKSQQAWRTTNTLGKVGKSVLTATKFLGVTTGAVQVGVKGFEIYNKGAENATLRDWSDLGVNSAGVVAAVFFASNPIGWTVGAIALTYSIGTTIYDASTKP